MPPKLRTVVYENHFEEQLDKLKQTEPRIGEFVEGVEWVVAKSPAFGKQITTNVWAVPLYKPRWMKHDYTIYYTFGADEAHFLSIIRVQPVEL